MSLVQLCASHIGSTRRLRALVRMLRSVADQSETAPMWLSVSASPELSERVVEALEGLDLTVRLRNRALKQFEHYALLVSEVPPCHEWCILCDDDDYCHPRRVAWYNAAISEAEAGNHDVVMCSNGTLSAYFRGATEADLEGLEAHAAANPKCIGLGGSEHWMFAAKTRALRVFCDNVDSSVLASPGCDIVWRNFMRISHCRFATSPTWLYAKTMEVDGSFGHTSLNHDVYDVESISALCKTSYDLLMRISGVFSCTALSRMNKYKELAIT